MIRLFNPAAEEMFGVTASEMLGAKLESLLPEASRKVHAEHVDAFAAEQRQRRVMGDWRVIAARRADGQLFPVLVSLSKSEIAGELVMTASLRDMSDTKRMQDGLIALANERECQAIRAEDANRAKSMFLATMSHELRTPLNAIIGFSDIAAREALGPLGNAKYKEYMEDIRASGELLLSHINDVLDLACIEADAYEMRPETVDVSEIITSCRKMMLVAQESKALRVTVTGEAGLIASVDRKAVQQVLLNLLSNAIKFSRQGGTIELGSRRLPDGRFEIWVTDTGCGMTAKDVERIGRPFVQLGNHYRAEVKGTGLGLSICRALLIRMGGHMTIRSEPGSGTTVTFDLPVAAVPPEAA